MQAGARTLKDAMNEALRDWVTNVTDTFYCIGTAAGPHPYPAMVRDFQCIIGDETRVQMLAAEGPTAGLALRLYRRRLQCDRAVSPFPRRSVRRDLWRRSGGLGARQETCSLARGGRPGVLHGNRTYLLMDADGQIEEGHSISAGLDYPGMAPNMRG